MDASGRYKVYLAVGGLALAGLTLLGLRIVTGSVGRLLDLLASVSPSVLAQVLILIIAGEAVRAVRLVVIARVNGVGIGFWGALAARLLGRWAALLSPASAASTPLRAGVIGAYSGAGVGEATAIAIMETLYDLILPVLFALFIGIAGFPETWLLLLVAITVLGLWGAGILFARTPSVEELVLRLTGRKEWWCYARRQRLLFLSLLRGGLSYRVVLPSLLLTLLAHVVEAMAVGASIGWEGGLIWWLIVLEASYAASMAPTPGGALVFEYGLAPLLDSRHIVAWRLAFIMAGLLPGSLIIVLVPRMRKYLEDVYRGIDKCVDRE